MKIINPFEDVYLSLKQQSLLSGISEVDVKKIVETLNIKGEASDSGDIYYSLDDCFLLNHSIFKTKYENINEAFYITMGTQKGGVGKTTLSYQIGLFLSFLGYKVLFADFDAQSNLTSLFNESIDESEFSLYDYFQSQNTLDELIIKVNENISLIPSNNSVGEINSILEKSSKETNDNSLSKLKQGLRAEDEFNSSLFLKFREDLRNVSREFDFVIFDTHPETNYLNRLALQASELCIVPMEPTKFSKGSLRKVVPELKQALLITDTESRDENIRVLLNLTRPLKNEDIKELKIKEMNKGFGKVLLDNHVNFHHELMEATDMSFPIWAYPETSKEAIIDIRNVTLELVDFISKNHFEVAKNTTENKSGRRILGW